MLAPLRVNRDAAVTQQAISRQQYCAVIDDFLENPEAVIDHAIAAAGEFAIPERSYPGLVLDVGASPMAGVYRFLRARMSREFGFLRGGARFSTVLSMMTLKPEELSNLQRLCHSDPGSGAGRQNYASVLYLFRNEELGGTAFYRWRDRQTIEKATALDLEDPRKALEFLQSQYSSYNEPPRYLTESNDVAEMLCMIPARFNRLIFYSGDVPHSAWISRPELLSSDPLQGRLTLNCFLSVKPGPC